MKFRPITKCVKCGKKARIDCGYVLNGKSKIIARWCSEECLNDTGFSGHYHPWMSDEVKK